MSVAFSPNIVVVGSANTDLVVDVSHIPRPGETILGGDLATIPGGKGANQAVAAARLGGNVRFIARVGDDAYGAAAIEGYRRDGIDTTFVSVTSGVPSGVALITVDRTSGQNAIVVAPGANAHLSPEDIDRARSAFEDAALVVASLEVPIETVVRAAERAAERRIPFLLNPAPARPLPPNLLTLTTVFTPNETEAAQILGIPPESRSPAEMAVALRDPGIRTVVVTVGRDGAVVADGTETTVVPGIPVTAIDTVAAGDCFTGALAVRLASGVALLDAVGYANRAAALKVTRRGAQPGLPTAAEVEAFG
ncbi:MAG: ribokinase [Capsulimonadales bacterium]|nr:ribokinase [Capsulimonadales bacterium]